MKVVLFCGGMGMRIRDQGDNVPKPMIDIGNRPILWHVMKYYAHHGHKDFILCLGYQARVIKDYFLHYNECLSNDFVLSNGGKHVELMQSDIQDWRITFADTGADSNIAQRLKNIQPYLENDEVFLASYSDGLTDFPLPRLLDHFNKQKKTAAFLCVKPNISYHFVSVKDGLVTGINDIHHSPLRINGGYFVFKRDIFDYIGEGEELVYEPFQRLIDKGELLAMNYDGFFASMDTFKDKQYLTNLYASGNAPWELWKRDAEINNHEHFATRNTVGNPPVTEVPVQTR
jgi:glucose-1-phosphate cytidylyltransferase